MRPIVELDTTTLVTSPIFYDGGQRKTFMYNYLD